MKQINIGIMGAGTIGLGVIHILSENLEKLNKKHGLNLKIHSVAAPEVAHLDIPSGIIKYTDGKFVAENPEIDIVVELIGGTGIAKTLMMQAISNKKHIVTANKAIISEHGKEISELASKNNVSLMYEASVGGVMPVIETISNYLSSNTITSIKGILNGTCNFMLTKMMEEGLGYEEALDIAQHKGFAEADPALDVSGADSCHKIAILARIAFGIDVSMKDIHYEGIQRLKRIDFDFAREGDYQIKLLASAKSSNGKYEISVRPMLINKDHLLAKVNNEYNAVLIEGNYSDPLLMVGKGAGRYPTATAVVSDIVKAATKMVYNVKGEVALLEPSKWKLVSIDDTYTKGYIRMLSVDQPGVLAKEARVIGENKINIVEFHQKTKYKMQRHVPDIIVIDKTKYSDINAALIQLSELECVEGEPFFLCIDE